MEISLFQFNPKWEDKSFNMQRILSILEKYSHVGEILLFPEMTLTGFSMNTSSLAEKMCDSTIAFCSAIARKYQTNVFAGMIEKFDDNYYNTLIHITPQGNLKNKYRKIHPFSYSSENKYFKAGSNLVVSKVHNWKIGLSICYDLRFPELYRFYAKMGVDLIIDIANWPDARIEHWSSLLKARAIENQCYIAGVNRVGRDLKLNYNGFSAVFDPMGKEIGTAKSKETILTVKLDKNYVKEVRKKLPFLNDMKLI